MRKLALHLLTVSALTIFSAPAMAWGDREQGVLQGLAGAWILGRMLQQQPDPQPVPPPVYYTPPPVYIQPGPPAVYYHRPQCYHVPYYDHYGRVAYYRQICR